MRDSVTAAPSQQMIVAWMARHIKSVLDLPPGDFPADERFDSYGLDSVEAVIMAGLMEEEFGVPIDPMEMFNNPSVTQFSAYLANTLAERAAA